MASIAIPGSLEAGNAHGSFEGGDTFGNPFSEKVGTP